MTHADGHDERRGRLGCPVLIGLCRGSLPTVAGRPLSIVSMMTHSTHAAATSSHHQNDECGKQRKIGEIAPGHVNSPS